MQSGVLGPEGLSLESEEEDSDMDGFVASDDDFLDDGDQGEGHKQLHDYSSEIRKMFHYDPTK